MLEMRWWWDAEREDMGGRSNGVRGRSCRRDSFIAKNEVRGKGCCLRAMREESKGLDVNGRVSEEIQDKMDAVEKG